MWSCNAIVSIRYIYCIYGSVLLTNDLFLLSISQAPNTAGVYETRYYPSALGSRTTGKYHDIYWMKAKFTVVQS